MRLKLSSSEDLKTIVSLVSNITEEAIFKATEEGVTFRGMDPSHVALTDISMPNTMFDEYDCIGETSFAIRVDEFGKLLKRADKKDNLEIEIDNGTLDLKIGNNKKYKLRLLESLSAQTPVPKIELENSFSIENTKLDSIISDIQVVAEFITIKVSDKIEFHGKGESSSVVVENQELDQVDIKSEATGTYSLEYLSPAVKSLSSSGGSVKLLMSHNKPLMFEFRIGDSGRIVFFLAPRVSD